MVSATSTAGLLWPEASQADSDFRIGCLMACATRCDCCVARKVEMGCLDISRRIIPSYHEFRAKAGCLDNLPINPTLAPVAIDLSRYSFVLLDLDGTIYHEDHPLPGAVEFVRRLQSQGRRFACLSNSPSSPLRVMDRLNKMGVDLEPDTIYTAAASTCDYILESFPSDKSRKPRVFNLCTESVREMLEGLVEWVQTSGEPCDVVIAGAPSNQYATEERQRIALALLRHGAALVGLCADRVYPSPRGLEFGAGALTVMLAYASNVRPIFCGKPESIFFIELCNRLKTTPPQCVLIGDNIESDVKGAKALGMGTILTLSGVTRRRDLQNLPAEMQPDFVIDDLTELLT